jgi:hypothetical protein
VAVVQPDGSTDNADLGALLQYTITGLERGTGYTVRVSAWNGVGNAYGSTQFSTPAVVKASRVPDSPASAWVQPAGPRSLLVSWEAPANTGYDDITSYNVAWDTNAGAAEVQRVTVAPTVPGTALHGTFTLKYVEGADLTLDHARVLGMGVVSGALALRNGARWV